MIPRLKQQITSYLATNPPGWCWAAKAEALAESVLVCRPRIAVELGVFGGRSLIPQAMALRDQPQGLLWGIDPWRVEYALAHLDPAKDSAHIAWWSTVDLEAMHAATVKAIYTWQVEATCALIRATSQKAATLFSPGTIDLLHIDGCHVEQVALDDVNRWLPLCRPGAHICMDDTNWASTQAAVRLLEQQCTLLQTLPDPATGSEARIYVKST